MIPVPIPEWHFLHDTLITDDRCYHKYEVRYHPRVSTIHYHPLDNTKLFWLSNQEMHYKY